MEAKEAEMTRFHLQRLDHVSLNVSDRDHSIAWYRDVLGLELTNKPQRDDWPAFMGHFGTCIGLFQAQHGRVHQPRPESVGLRHVAFMLARQDFERAQAHLVERGVNFRFEDHSSAHSVYLKDPDGYSIELTTYEL
jgi:catechol-2,3-dioxygenase